MKDMFGNEITEAQARKILGAGLVGQPRKRKDPTPAGYAWRPGTGPEGETCKTCAHHVIKRLGGTYHKCEIIRAKWTGGRKTDILVWSPACKFWEADQPKTSGEAS